jgi:hypothetical protein
MEDVRFTVDEDNDIVDNSKLKVYAFGSKDSWERLCILLNSLELQRRKVEERNNEIITIVKEEFEEYNNYIDEYSLIKTDILMDLLEKLKIEVD